MAENGAAGRLAVANRYRDGDQVWIETDARPGVQVVTEGASKLREGSQVAAASSEGPGASVSRKVRTRPVSPAPSWQR
ncbi:hypothetical protein OCH239_03775 [Roseivivax halodurans JCM 10272]|uniref:Uncharacterized protein n=1 Tax=Roseivivax halodurans JCM 10272 TaxID=1449350 RepID=X7EEU8_9RHOB|nr:hypothetical protein [Roseivivax halodurans]ETX14427.1 hypothetical protein OCH239_03775 [Roseivivax halodurans JCM 10272]